MKRALITGIGGQDGSYLADILLEKGYEVHGLQRHSSMDNLARISHVRDLVTVYVGDVTDALSVVETVRICRPDEVYHMADQDHVRDSNRAPSYQFDVTLRGVLNVLAASCQVNARVFVPISATVFSVENPPQSEESPINPQSIYAVAKAAAWNLCKLTRKLHRMFIACGIMFNHDSPRRGRDYLLQRIARGVPLRPDTDLDAVVDIGYAREYMEAAWKMLQLDQPDDFCIGTGRQIKISSLVQGWDIERRFDPISSCLIADCGKAWRDMQWASKHGAFSTMQLIKESL